MVRYCLAPEAARAIRDKEFAALPPVALRGGLCNVGALTLGRLVYVSPTVPAGQGTKCSHTHTHTERSAHDAAPSQCKAVRWVRMPGSRTHTHPYNPIEPAANVRNAQEQRLRGKLLRSVAQRNQKKRYELAWRAGRCGANALRRVQAHGVRQHHRTGPSPQVVLLYCCNQRTARRPPPCGIARHCDHATRTAQCPASTNRGTQQQP